MGKSNRSKNGETELDRDAWQRFERAVDVVAKSPPQHREKKTVRKRKARKTKPGK